MARMKKQNEKHEKITMLAKSKTRKGGLGKNEHPDGLTTFKGNSSKNRGNTKKTIPRWIENPKGRSRQKWDDEKRKMKWKKQTCKSIDHRCDVQSTYVTVPTSSNTIQTILQLPAFDDGLGVSSNDGISRKGTFTNICPSASHYVPNIPMFCLPLRNCVYKLPIIMRSKTFIHA